MYCENQLRSRCALKAPKLMLVPLRGIPTKKIGRSGWRRGVVIGAKVNLTRSMRALMLTQYFTPELTAAAARLHAFSELLARRGHEIEVICGVPNHPLGVVADGYGGRVFDRRSLDGFEVNYVWVPTSTSRKRSARIVNYGGYAAMASLAGALARRPDVIFASSPPLPVGAAGMMVAGRHRVPWVLDVRDLWPAAAVAVGELTGRRAVAASEALERRLYRSAAAITTPSESSAGHISAIAGSADKVHHLPSGTTEDWLRLGDSEVDRAQLGVSQATFAWTYAGNIGLAQDLATAVEAAALLGEGFRLVIVGDGPVRAEVEALARRVAPGLVTFTGLLPRERAGALMRASDALLISLANSPGIAYAVPSKLYDCCAVGRPVIVASGGEAARLAEREGVALTVAPGEPAALADAVRRLRDDPALRDSLTGSGRAFAAANLRERQGERLESILASVSRSA
jgi:colanic acid biosynthesis glycosyl transferase WcaI